MVSPPARRRVSQFRSNAACVSRHSGKREPAKPAKTANLLERSHVLEVFAKGSRQAVPFGSLRVPSPSGPFGSPSPSGPSFRSYRDPSGPPSQNLRARVLPLHVHMWRFFPIAIPRSADPPSRGD